MIGFTRITIQRFIVAASVWALLGLYQAGSTQAQTGPPVDVANAQHGVESEEGRKHRKSRRRARGRRARKKRARERRKRRQRERERRRRGQSAPSDTTATTAEPSPAQSSVQTPAPTPWSDGVSPDSQELALALFRGGNQLLRESELRAAIEKYDAALEHWDHPRIHYMRSRALIFTNQPIAAYRSVGKALRYDGKALKPEQLEQALLSKQLLEQQVTELDITCEVEGAEVTMNGELLFRGPGRIKRLQRVGRYQLTASKPGHITVSQHIDLKPGSTDAMHIALPTIAEMTVTTRRWASWKPQAVIAAGSALGLVGGFLHWRGNKGVALFDGDFPDTCPAGCRDDDPTSPIARARRAHWQQRAGVAAYALGGTALATGLVLLFANRPESFRLDERQDVPGITVTPALSGSAATLQAHIRF